MFNTQNSFVMHKEYTIADITSLFEDLLILCVILFIHLFFKEIFKVQTSLILKLKIKKKKLYSIIRPQIWLRVFAENCLWGDFYISFDIIYIYSSVETGWNYLFEISNISFDIVVWFISFDGGDGRWNYSTCYLILFAYQDCSEYCDVIVDSARVGVRVTVGVGHCCCRDTLTVPCPEKIK
jgi:hypothetical protein